MPHACQGAPAAALFGLKIGGLFSIAYVNAPWSFAKVLDLLRHLPVPIIVSV